MPRLDDLLDEDLDHGCFSEMSIVTTVKGCIGHGNDGLRFKFQNMFA